MGGKCVYIYIYMATFLSLSRIGDKFMLIHTRAVRLFKIILKLQCEKIVKAFANCTTYETSSKRHKKK